RVDTASRGAGAAARRHRSHARRDRAPRKRLPAHPRQEVMPPMFGALRDFFEKQLGGTTDTPERAQQALELAAAALLVEVARIDGAMQPSERDAVLRAIHEQFSLPDDEARRLLESAEREMESTEGYFPFTSLINAQFTQEQKEHLIELMW